MRKVLYVAIVLGLVIVVYLGYLKWGGKKSFAAREIIQPVVKKNSRWKYLVKRTIITREGPKKETSVDRAFAYFGAGAKQAGGQIKSVPQAVYVDEDGNRLAKAVYYESAIVPHDSKKLGLFSMLPGDPGSDPNVPGPAHILPKSFSILPLSPEAELRKGLNWSSTLYLYIGMDTEFMFPAEISHEVTGYERKLSRRCAAVKYAIAGEFKSVEHPELLRERERRNLRGEYHLKGNGTAYFDPAEGIIVEKEQTVSWTRFGEMLEQLEDGKVGWVPTVDDEKTVTIKVSLQPEEGEAVSLPAGTGHPLLSYLLIAAVIGIAIVGLILLLKKRTSKSRI